jgi:hypothetical protein
MVAEEDIKKALKIMKIRELKKLRRRKKKKKAKMKIHQLFLKPKVKETSKGLNVLEPPILRKRRSRMGITWKTSRSILSVGGYASLLKKKDVMKLRDKLEYIQKKHNLKKEEVLNGLLKTLGNKSIEELEKMIL